MYPIVCYNVILYCHYSIQSIHCILLGVQAAGRQVWVGVPPAGTQ